MESDEAFFKRQPHRQIRIRHIYKGEMNREFMSLGLHDEKNRRMIVWKVPANVRTPYSGYAGRAMKIPYIKDPSDEIEDNDKFLMPILEGLMRDASIEHGIGGTS